MPRAFDITASTSTVSLTPAREGEVTFTVSNALRLPVRVRAVVEPSGGARPEWLRLPGGAEKELPPDGTALFPVKVAVPPEAPPGDYAFTLLVASVANPDEDYARGPMVAFTVPAAEAPAKPPFPWWLVGLIGGALLIVGGVVLAFFLRGDPPPGVGQFCAREEPRCAEGLVCAGEGRCLGDTGFPCERSEVCASGRCVDGACRPALLELGERCEEDEQCRSGNCRRRVCERGCTPPCESGLTCVDGECRKVTVVPALRPCDSDADCTAAGTRCADGRCRRVTGEPCTGDFQCVSRQCVDERCR